MKINLKTRVIGAGAEFPAGEQDVEERFRPFFETLAGSEPGLVTILSAAPEPAPIPPPEIPKKFQSAPAGPGDDLRNEPPKE